MFALSQSLIRSSALRQGVKMMQTTAVRPVTIKIVPPAVGKKETYEEKNIRLGRELSPHLTIYKPQLTSMLSITHRGTGFAISVYAWALGLGALVSSQDVSHYVTMIEGLQLSSASLTALKFLIAFPMAYHTCNGIRHLVWDTGRFLQIKDVYATGYVMVAASFVLGAILAVL